MPKVEQWATSNASALKEPEAVVKGMRSTFDYVAQKAKTLTGLEVRFNIKGKEAVKKMTGDEKYLLLQPYTMFYEAGRMRTDDGASLLKFLKQEGIETETTSHDTTVFTNNRVFLPELIDTHEAQAWKTYDERRLVELRKTRLPEDLVTDDEIKEELERPENGGLNANEVRNAFVQRRLDAWRQAQAELVRPVLEKMVLEKEEAERRKELEALDTEKAMVLSFTMRHGAEFQRMKEQAKLYDQMRTERERQFAIVWDWKNFTTEFANTGLQNQRGYEKNFVRVSILPLTDAIEKGQEPPENLAQVCVGQFGDVKKKMDKKSPKGIKFDEAEKLINEFFTPRIRAAKEVVRLDTEKKAAYSAWQLANTDLFGKVAEFQKTLKLHDVKEMKVDEACKALALR